MISSTPTNLRSADDETSTKDEKGNSASEGQEISLLRRALQEQRRATTLLHAEAEQERQLREALEAQLVEANTEIVSSWDRRKEMARVLGELQTRLAQVSAEHKAFSQRISQREQVIINREKAISKRDEALAKRDVMIANRDEKIRQLKAELQSRYEELAALQRNVVESSLSGRARRLARQARGFTRKTFQG